MKSTLTGLAVGVAVFLVVLGFLLVQGWLFMLAVGIMGLPLGYSEATAAAALLSFVFGRGASLATKVKD